MLGRDGFLPLPVQPVEGHFEGRSFTALPLQDTLGEGPLWHHGRDALLWFDITGRFLLRLTPDTGLLESAKLSETASAAGIIDDHSILLATSAGLGCLDVDNGAWRPLMPFPAAAADVRPNDGRCDPWGRFWIGTMADPVRPDSGALYRFDGTLTVLRQSVTVPNAIAFAPDRRTAYFADSPTRTIVALDLDAEDGTILGTRPFARLDGPGIPDGAVVDAEGFLWNAEWDGARLTRYAPDGRIASILRLPVSRPTCPAFGGPDLRTLFITSARYGLDAADLAREPLAGALLAFDVGVAGQAEPAVTCL
ncbi:MAG: SMP-30/gluconolactonase/LRE family protein [Proteobacteria bacterium]|nr:SMP-30/gluconolactonase/LRE family protein [Pseudomonadota bacterium]